jgi:hypothetical protein
MGNVYQASSGSHDDVEQQNFWLRTVSEQNASGIGLKRFCQQHKISFSKLKYWKYVKQKIKPVSDSVNDVDKQKHTQDEKAAAKFIPLQIATDAPPDECPTKEVAVSRDKTVEIIFRSGHKIILPLVISDANLLLLIKIVSGLKC